MRPGLMWSAGIVWTTILVQAGVVLAAQSTSREDRIRESAQRVEKAASPLNEVEADERLAEVFDVKPGTAMDRRDERVGLGQVAMVLALAEDGRSSPDAILSLWASGRINWGEIAERSKVNLSDLLRHLDTIRRELSRRGL